MAQAENIICMARGRLYSKRGHVHGTIGGKEPHVIVERHCKSQSKGLECSRNDNYNNIVGKRIPVQKR